METAVLSDLEHLNAASGVMVSGDLWLDQVAPFWSSGRDPNHGGPLINESNLDLAQYKSSNIALRNSFRNFTTALRRYTTFVFRVFKKIQFRSLFLIQRGADPNTSE